MTRMVRIAAGALLIAPLALPAQAPAPLPSAGPVSAVLVAIWSRVSRNMPGAAELMPADKFGFKPTPGQLSFGEIIAHEAEANETLCTGLGGAPSNPSESTAGATAPKDQLVARLKQSFETCGAVIAKVPDSALGDTVPFFGGRKATKARAMIALAQDWSDHYAQAAMYLRLNGILPPTAQPPKK